MHTLLFYEPGHFHAALLLAAHQPALDRRIHVYATPGPDLDRFTDLVQGFNDRAEAPTEWLVDRHVSPDPLDRLIRERRGELVVVAGRNEPKLTAIARLHAAGFNVLADKPWLTTGRDLDRLDRVTAAPPLAIDLMTQRHEPIARLRRRIVATASVFGRFLTARESDGGPAIEARSIHHLCKLVDGRPLQRPAWYYDVRVQGDGLVDIQSHMVDQAQWLVGEALDGRLGAGGPTASPGASLPLELERARRWSTPVPLDAFAESTGLDAFPETLLADVHDGELHLSCNGELDYRCAGVRVRQRAEWRVHPPAGGGDAHRSVVRGTGAVITIDHGPATDHRPQLHVGPVSPSTGRSDVEFIERLTAAVEAWRADHPGLTMRPSHLGHELVLPPAAHVAHEATFASVLDEFLRRVDAGGWSRQEAGVVRDRYRLLAEAQARATTTHP